MSLSLIPTLLQSYPLMSSKFYDHAFHFSEEKLPWLKEMGVAPPLLVGIVGSEHTKSFVYKDSHPIFFFKRDYIVKGECISLILGNEVGQPHLKVNGLK